MMWASQQAGEKNSITTLVSLVKITDITRISQKRRFLGNGVVLAMY